MTLTVNNIHFWSEIIRKITSAWIILNQKFIQSHPTASNTDHDCWSENTDQTQLLRFAKLDKKKFRLVFYLYVLGKN